MSKRPEKTPMSNRRLEGKIALITGSTRGIGEQLAYGFAKEGAKVAVTGRKVEDGLRVVDTIRKGGGVAEFIPIDLTNEQSVADCVAKTVSHFGGLTVLINNAAPTDHVTGATTGHDGKMSDKADTDVANLTTEQWRKIMTAGLDGLFWVLKYSVPAMQQSGGGSIVNISSIASIQGVGGTDAYTVTKGGMNSLTRAVAVNYAKDNIRCNCLVAGAFATPAAAPLLNDPVMKQAFLDTMLAKDVAPPSAMVGPAVFFASDESWYITGQLLPVDGGLTVKMPIPKLER